MTIRKHLQSPASVSTRSDPPSFTDSVNHIPTPEVRNMPSSNHIVANNAGVTKPNDKGSDSVELMQTPSSRKIANKEEIDKPRVCTSNKSPSDVPSFVRGFLTKPTTEPTDNQSMQNSSRTSKKLRRSNLASDTKLIAEANQQVLQELSNCRAVRRETEDQEWILNVHRWMNIQQLGEVACADVESIRVKGDHLFCVQHKRRNNADFVELHDSEDDLD